MTVKERITEFKEEHPKVTKAVKVVAGVATMGAGAALIYAGYNEVKYCVEHDVRIEINSKEFREARIKVFGDARELENAALGIMAKDLDPTKTLARRDAILEPYI